MTKKYSLYLLVALAFLLLVLAFTLASASPVSLKELNKDPGRYRWGLVITEGEMAEMEVIYSHFVPQNPKSRVGFDWRLNQYGFADSREEISLRTKYLASVSLNNWIEFPEPSYWKWDGRLRVLGIWWPSDDEGHYHLRILKVWKLDKTETGR